MMCPRCGWMIVIGKPCACNAEAVRRRREEELLARSRILVEKVREALPEMVESLLDEDGNATFTMCGPMLWEEEE